MVHRVYEMALEWSAPNAPAEFSVGRMLRNDWRGVVAQVAAALRQLSKRSSASSRPLSVGGASADDVARMLLP